MTNMRQDIICTSNGPVNLYDHNVLIHYFKKNPVAPFTNMV